MSEFEKLLETLNPSIKASKICLSYVERLLPELKGSPCIVLHQASSLKTLENDTKLQDIDDIETSKFDVTGSPLKYSFEDDNFEDTIILIKRHWLKEEEKYLPLTRIQACNALNACLQIMSKASIPIIALCDSKDNMKTRLLGTIVQGGWFTTIQVYSTGTETLKEVKNSSFAFLRDHVKLSSVPEHNITVSTFNTFNMFGTKEEMIDWNENLKSTFEGSLSIEVDTCSLSLDPPTRASKNDLVVQIVTGSDNSPLKESWKQLLLLNQYLTIMEEYENNLNAQHNPVLLKFPDDYKAPHTEEHDKILQNIKLLLNQDYSYRDTDSQKVDIASVENIENDVKINQCVRNLSCRENLDFTDLLWDLLIRNSNYFQITKCFHMVLEEIASGDYLTQVNFTNATRFGKTVSNPDSQKIIHFLSGSLPLEYLVDMGIEKLRKDYMYILVNTRLCDLQDVQRKLGNVSSREFKVEAYRKKLICMAQIHVCLEFVLIIQNNLGCPTESLRTLFSCAFKRFVCDESPIRNHEELYQNTIYSLKAPVSVSLLDHLNKEIPSTRRISLSSQSKLFKLTTTKYYSILPIFPTNIYPPDDPNTTDVTYHITNVVRSSNRFK